MARVRRITKLLAIFFIFMAAVLPRASDAAQRVVSLYAAHTENIVALGAGGLLAGISSHDDPGLLPKLPRVPANAGAEVILALCPDLVLTRSFSVSRNPNLYKVLREAGVRVVVLDPPAWEDFPDYLEGLARLLGADSRKAAGIFKKISKNIADTAKMRSKGKKAPLVFVESTSPGLRTCAPDSWAANLIRLAGGRNAAAGAVQTSKGSAVAAWGLERLLRTAESGLDVYIVQHGAMNAATLEDVKRRSWASALKNTKIAEVPEAYLSRASLSGLEKGGKMLIDIFYGE